MKRVLVVGCPGSGKSVFSRALAEKTGLPLCHLDLLKWNADKTTVDRVLFLNRLERVLAGEEWIIDGNYASTMALRMDRCDTFIFLDYPTELCLEGIKARRGTPRPDMPWVDTEEDEEFTAFVLQYNTVSRSQVLELIARHPEKRCIVFKSREEAEELLQSL